MNTTISAMEKIILKALLSNNEFSRKTTPHMKKEYFESQLSKFLFEAFSSYFSKYNNIPTRDYIQLSVEKNDMLNEEQFAESKQIINEVYAEKIDKYDDKWLTEETEKWCQERGLFNAIIESINIMDGTDKKTSSHAIPDKIKDALAISFDTRIGHDYLEDVEQRYEFYHDVTQKFPFDLSLFNKITKGGISRKTMNCILSQTGGGKSQLMCHFASSYIQSGLNVLYITCEMAEERISERIDANLMGVDIGEIPKMNQMTYYKRIEKMKKKVNGRLIVKEYPAASANVNHFRQLLQELKLKKNFIPDIVFIDYLNICASARYTGLSGVNSYMYVKAIAEEIRGMAQEQNIAIWTATQTNRDGLDASDVSLANTSESIGLPQTLDLMFALIPVDELEEKGQILVKQLKNRYNDLNYYKKFVIGMDRSRMTFYDSTMDAGNGMSDNGTQDPVEQDLNEFGVGFGTEHADNGSKFSGIDFE